ncbi:MULTISPECIES: hypothetical protein [Micromonospora]|uniref:Uncharacterized protein n=1 Tax=Micromonospora chokoriensis TaxID=356851 RepID=A0A1C4YJN9_9ACTN|nr:MULTISPECIES: hypothetical protein [Micromonospora]MCZ7373796.1 hypothetical protein [Micromonospora sp. WMMC250]SCF20866.1 hypothetical protein GA0070612_4845 [Micromonospora chokoriensis]
MTPEEEWQASQARRAAEAARWEESTRRKLDANRAALATRQAWQPAEIAEIQHRFRVAMMGGGSLLPTNGDDQ